MERSGEFRGLLKLFGATDIPSEVRAWLAGRLVCLLVGWWVLALHLAQHTELHPSIPPSSTPAPTQEDQDLLLQAAAIPSEDEAAERQMPTPASDFAAAAATVAKGFQGTLRCALRLAAREACSIVCGPLGG